MVAGAQIWWCYGGGDVTPLSGTNWCCLSPLVKGRVSATYLGYNGTIQTVELSEEADLLGCDIVNLCEAVAVGVPTQCSHVCRRSMYNVSMRTFIRPKPSATPLNATIS